MPNLTLEQIEILEALKIAEVACQDAATMIGCQPSTWVNGRREGTMLERLEDCQRNLSSVQIGLTILMDWK